MGVDGFFSTIIVQKIRRVHFHVDGSKLVGQAVKFIPFFYLIFVKIHEINLCHVNYGGITTALPAPGPLEVRSGCCAETWEWEKHCLHSGRLTWNLKTPGW